MRRRGKLAASITHPSEVVEELCRLHPPPRAEPSFLVRRGPPAAGTDFALSSVKVLVRYSPRTTSCPWRLNPGSCNLFAGHANM